MSEPTMANYKARLSTARWQISEAVKRFASITDPLPGHRIEAVRLAKEVRDEADRAVKALERNSNAGD